MESSSVGFRANASISDLTKASISRFELCSSRGDHGNQVAMENGLADLRLWDEGVGATASERASLDWRFRERPEDLMLVKTILMILYDFLGDYLTSKSSQSIQAIVQWIQSSIENLATIGVAIRRTGKASRHRKVESSFDQQEYKELRRHLEVITLLRPSEEGLKIQPDSSNLTPVQQRLIEANLMRRHRTVVAHRRSRTMEQKETHFSHDSPSIPHILPQEPDQVGSQSSEFQVTGAPPLKTDDTRTIDGLSAASTAEGTLQYGPQRQYKPGVAKTNITAIGEHAEFPMPPPNPKGRLIGKCPCCCQSIGIELMNDSNKWRQHVIEDICPYTCIIEECPNPTLLFNTRREWESHVKIDHGSEWACPLCEDGETAFQIKRDIIQHLEGQHLDAVKQFELSTLLDGSRTPRIGISTCPLCTSVDRKDSPEIIDHVLKHVYEFSMRALPWPMPPPSHELNGPIGTYKVPDDKFEAGRITQWVRDASSEPLTDPHPPPGDIKFPSQAIEYSDFDAAPHDEADSTQSADKTHYVPMDEYFNMEAMNDSWKPQAPSTASFMGPSSHRGEGTGLRDVSIAADQSRSHRDYTIGWICALPIELSAATLMLDMSHEPLPTSESDNNVYKLGSIGEHNIVVACLPAGVYGTSTAASTHFSMRASFPSIDFFILLGIGGGIPPKVRLGDVVVGTPNAHHSAVIQYDLGKLADLSSLVHNGSLDNPSKVLENALKHLQGESRMHTSRVIEHMNNAKEKHPRLGLEWTHRNGLKDVLFDPSSHHLSEPDPDTTEWVQKGEMIEETNEDDCVYCDKSKIVEREPRPLEIHYGLILSGNSVIKDADVRDTLNESLGGNALCIEMEAAGMPIDLPCVVVRGICDYCDSHKNKAWQKYAATAAAAVGKEIVLRLSQSLAETMERDAIRPSSSTLYDVKDHFPKEVQNYLDWKDNYRDAYKRVITPFVGDPVFRPVRIALLDSGVDQTHRHLQAAQIIDTRNWTSEVKEKVNDRYGHGTFSAGLLLDYAPDAELYIAKVFDEVLSPPAVVAQAIRTAVDEWEVDIISMPFGYPTNQMDDLEELRQALGHASLKNVLLFAGASDNALSRRRPWPARDLHVLCVSSTDSRGNWSNFNPYPSEHDLNIATIGEGIQSVWPKHLCDMSSNPDCLKHGSGTGYATSIMVGISASLLQYAKVQRPATAYMFKRQDRMRELLIELTRQATRDHYRYIGSQVLDQVKGAMDSLIADP